MSNFNTCISAKNVLYLDVLQCRRRHGASIRPARYLCVNSKAKGDETTGIHDPAGPHGAAWGSGIPKGGKNEAAQEARMVEAASRMDAKAHLSDQKHHNKSPGHISSINRENIENEIEGIEAEKRVYDSDEEYSHMSTVQKWLMEAKAKLYEFLKTGVEPL